MAAASIVILTIFAVGSILAFFNHAVLAIPFIPSHEIHGG